MTRTCGSVLGHSLPKVSIDCSSFLCPPVLWLGSSSINLFNHKRNCNGDCGYHSVEFGPQEGLRGGFELKGQGLDVLGRNS